MELMEEDGEDETTTLLRWLDVSCLLEALEKSLRGEDVFAKMIVRVERGEEAILRWWCSTRY